VQALVRHPHQPRDLRVVGVQRGIRQRGPEHCTHLVFDAFVEVVALVLEAVGDPEVVVLFRGDAEFFLQALLGGLDLRLAVDGVGGDRPVPVGVPQPLVRAALCEQDPSLAVEQ
jgi:hypothetical protein